MPQTRNSTTFGFHTLNPAYQGRLGGAIADIAPNGIKVARVLKLFLLFILTVFLICACSGRSSLNSPNSGSLSPGSGCRVIQHAMGETCVPANPQRLVVLSAPTLSDVLALGVQPIGTTSYDNTVVQLPSYLEGRMNGIEFVGYNERPNLEKILRLKPDLIIGWEYSNKAIYSQLSQIAPTVLDDWVGYPSWKDHFNFVAEVLGKTEAAEQVWKHYHQRIQELRTALGDRLQHLEVSFVHTCCGTVDIDLKNSFIGSILDDAGLRRPPPQNATEEDGIVLLSEERLMDIDGDILFVATYDDESTRTLEELKRKPLWNNLRAVQQGRVYRVDYSVWRGGNTLAANAVINDLFKYLVEDAQR